MSRHNAFLTPGGIFSHRYLKWALEVVGDDRVMFAADFPYVPTSSGAARNFLTQAELTDDVRDTDRHRYLGSNPGRDPPLTPSTAIVPVWPNAVGPSEN